MVKRCEGVKRKGKVQCTCRRKHRAKGCEGRGWRYLTLMDSLSLIADLEIYRVASMTYTLTHRSCSGKGAIAMCRVNEWHVPNFSLPPQGGHAVSPLAAAAAAAEEARV